MRATRPSLLDPLVDGPQGSIPRTSRLSQWPQALDSDVSQNPQGGGRGSATQSRQLYASEARTQSEPKRAVEEFFLFGDGYALSMRGYAVKRNTCERATLHTWCSLFVMRRGAHILYCTRFLFGARQSHSLSTGSRPPPPKRKISPRNPSTTLTYKIHTSQNPLLYL